MEKLPIPIIIIIISITLTFFLTSNYKQKEIDKIEKKQLSRFNCVNPIYNINRAEERIFTKNKDREIYLLKQENDDWSDFALCLYKSF